MSDWSSDVCSSDLEAVELVEPPRLPRGRHPRLAVENHREAGVDPDVRMRRGGPRAGDECHSDGQRRSADARTASLHALHAAPCPPSATPSSRRRRLCLGRSQERLSGKAYVHMFSSRLSPYHYQHTFPSLSSTFLFFFLF